MDPMARLSYPRKNTLIYGKQELFFQNFTVNHGRCGQETAVGRRKEALGPARRIDSRCGAMLRVRKTEDEERRDRETAAAVRVVVARWDESLEDVGHEIFHKNCAILRVSRGNFNY